MSTDKYVNFISSQVKRERTIGFRPYDSVTEAYVGKVEPPKKVTNIDPDAYHVGSTKHGHHVFAAGDTDRGEALSYAVQHPDKKVTLHTIEHGGKAPSPASLAKKSKSHDAHDLHPDVHKILHKDMKDELGGYAS